MSRKYFDEQDTCIALNSNFFSCSANNLLKASSSLLKEEYRTTAPTKKQMNHVTLIKTETESL